MFTLRLLGGLSLDGPVTGRAGQRRRRATALHDLRKTLGPQSVVSRGDGVGLDPSCLTTDVAAFEAALVAEDWEEAVTLYRGPFLDAVYVAGPAEFDHWADARRATLEREFLRALEALAPRREDTGDAVGARNGLPGNGGP